MNSDDRSPHGDHTPATAETATSSMTTNATEMPQENGSPSSPATDTATIKINGGGGGRGGDGDGDRDPHKSSTEPLDKSAPLDEYEDEEGRKRPKVTLESLKTVDGWISAFITMLFAVLPILTWLPQYKCVLWSEGLERDPEEGDETRARACVCVLWKDLCVCALPLSLPPLSVSLSLITGIPFPPAGLSGQWLSKLFRNSPLDRHDWKDKFAGDLRAGLTVGVLLIPQGLAYALLAELPVEYGLFSAFMPPLVYGFLGTSSELSVAPVAVVSLLTSAGSPRCQP